MTEQTLDVRRSWAAIRRHRMLVALVGVIGIVAGVAYGLAKPAPLSAFALVLLPPSATTSAGTPIRDTATQVAIATSDPVLDRAGKSVSPVIRGAQLKPDVTVTALSQNVLSVRVQAKQGAEAARLANAVASGYISYVTTNAAVSKQFNGEAGARAIRILQRATDPGPVSKLRLPLFGAIGLGGGLFLGAIVAISVSQRDRRLRRRDDLVAAVGVPVLASVEAERCRTAEDWLRVLDRYQPPVVDAWALRRLLRQLNTVDGRPNDRVRMVSFAEDHGGLAIGPQLAAFAASVGVSTELAPDDNPAVTALRAACRANPQPSRPARLHTVDSPHAPATRAEVELGVSVTPVNRNQPQLEDAAPTTTILAVSAGFATVDDVARVALAAVDCGRPIQGIVVANPDPDDSTTGGVTDFGGRRRPPPTLGNVARVHTGLTGRARSQST